MPDASLHVLIVDDDPLARRAIRDALQDAGMVVVADAPGGREGIELTLHYRPDVVLIDVIMPQLDGFATLEAIIAGAPEIRCVMLTVSSEPDVGLAAVRAGASGYLVKAELDVSALPRALWGVARGELACSRTFMLRLAEELRMTPATGVGVRPVRSRLTQREWEVLDMLCLGLGTDEIAARLVLSPDTVRSHIKHLLHKLGVRSREEAVRAAALMRQPRAADRGAPIATAVRD